MFEKFGMKRGEVFINSKQGVLNHNAFEDAPVDLVFSELTQATSLREDDFVKFDPKSPDLYSLHPIFLNYSLNVTLSRLHLQTLDCALLFCPQEITNFYEMEYATAERRREKYLSRLALAFEFYENAVQDGRLRSYGLTGLQSLLQTPEDYKLS